MAQGDGHRVPLLSAGESVTSVFSLSGLEEPDSPDVQLSVDPSRTLRDFPVPSASGRTSALDAVRESYIHHLQQYRLVSAGYVPNLVPILRWNATSRSATASAVPSPSSVADIHSAGSCRRTAKEKVGSLESLAEDHGRRQGRARSKGSFSESFRPGSIRSSVVNVTAAALGAGALALPRAMYYSGLIFGPIFMLVLAVLACMSIKVIVTLVEVTHKNSYEEIAKVAYGPWFALLVEVNIILFCFGTAVAYMITVGQISHQVVDALLGPVGAVWWSWLVSPNVMLCLVTLFVLLPLSVLDSINDLRFASLAGVGCVLYLIGVVVYIFLTGHTNPSLVTDDGFSGMQPKNGLLGCFKMLSLAIFAFCCQPNVPSIYTELERKSFRRMETVSRLAMAFCLVIYMVMGVAGFLAFGEGTQGNVLANLQPYLCERDLVVVSGFGCMAFAVTMAFPLNIFPIRFAIQTALFYRQPKWDKPGVRFAIAAGAVFSSLAVAIALPSINVIFEVIGATTGSFVCFIGPGLLFCRLGPGPLWSPAKLESIFLIVAGVLFLCLGTYSSMLDVIEQFQNGAALQPVGCARGQVW